MLSDRNIQSSDGVIFADTSRMFTEQLIKINLKWRDIFGLCDSSEFIWSLSVSKCGIISSVRLERLIYVVIHLNKDKLRWSTLRCLTLFNSNCVTRIEDIPETLRIVRWSMRRRLFLTQRWGIVQNGQGLSSVLGRPFRSNLELIGW